MPQRNQEPSAWAALWCPLPLTSISFRREPRSYRGLPDLDFPSHFYRRFLIYMCVWIKLENTKRELRIYQEALACRGCNYAISDSLFFRR